MIDYSVVQLDQDEMLGLVSAMAESQNVSESEIFTQDIEEVSRVMGWEIPVGICG